MNKINVPAAILKFINGSNDSRKYLQGVYDYITDPVKTDNGTLVATHGCSKNHSLEDIFANKKLHNKTNGKQGEHFVISFNPKGTDTSYLNVLETVKEIVGTVYPENMAIIAVHTDSRVPHAHILLDSVNAVTGKKFSQSPSDLNRVKLKVNTILKKHGFEVITASANEFIDKNDYSNAENYSFLELDESQLITEADMEEISSFIGTIDFDNSFNLATGWENPNCYSKNFIGGYTEMNTNSESNCTLQTQEFSAQTSMNDIVPTPTETAKNSLPNTTVVTGPTFRIKGNEHSNFSGINELVEQTAAYAQEHQRETANLALAMQKHSQDNGYKTNISVISGPIFDIDLTGGLSENVSDIIEIYSNDN